MALNHGSEEPDFRRPSRLAAGVAAGLLVAIVLYVFSQLVDKSYGPAVFATPFFIGVTTGALDPQRPYRSAFLALALALGLGILTLREGVICVLFSLPVLIPTLLFGSYLGKLLARYARSRKARNASLGGFLILGLLWHVVEAICDDPARHPEHVAEAGLLIASPPARVFSVLTRGELTVRDDWPWFIRVGLPMPRSMSLRNPGPNAELRFDIGQGTAFGSVIRWQEDRELSYRIDRFEIEDLPFYITRLGRSPNYGFRSERVEDWLSIRSVRYSLRPVGTSGTWLSRRVVWRRHLAPGFYFGWLQQVVMERGQRRLLALLSEKMSPVPALPSGPRSPDASVSHVCTLVHTPKLGGHESCSDVDGTVSAVSWATAAERPGTPSWDRSNDYSH
jgi:hypothetical protein